MFAKIYQTTIDYSVEAARQIQQQALTNIDTFIIKPLQQLESTEVTSFQNTLMDHVAKFNPLDSLSKVSEFYSQFIPASK